MPASIPGDRHSGDFSHHLLMTPRLIVTVSVIEVGVGQFFPWGGSGYDAREVYTNGGPGLIVLTRIIAPLLEEMLFRAQASVSGSNGQH
ncbi:MULTISPECIES: hypothetical protein [Burkholderia]|uniref:hypothetical protein n=1 Tax=Burkholderia TaxID=32008 RepID=UPI00211B1882|nr:MULTISPECIES: hypothetical protein [Burkholderia]